MKLLALDIGNTHVKCGIFQDGQLLSFDRVPTDRQHPERLQTTLQALINRQQPYQGAVFCSVVPEVEPVVMQSLQAVLPTSISPLQISPVSSQYPIDLGHYPTRQLGADRLVNLCAALQLYPRQSVIVLDFGTATTVDVVNEAGQYLGGVIAPGMETFAGILSLKTSQLSPVSFIPPHHALGQNTQDCLQAGINIGYVGMLREILQRIQTELLSPTALTLATGGLAETFQTLAQGSLPFGHIVPTLTLQGLAILYQENQLCPSS